MNVDAKALHVGLKAPDTLPLASTSSLARPKKSKALELEGWQKEVAAVAQHSLNNIPEKASVAVLAPVLNVVRILQAQPQADSAHSVRMRQICPQNRVFEPKRPI